jgi:membrane-bound lytic murein transglycosylase D
MKKLLLLTALPVTAFLSSFAGKTQGYGDVMNITNDTTIYEEVLLANPKTAFKDLFETSSSESYEVKLNPQAVSFVQSYMVANSNKLNAMKSWGKRHFDMMDNVLNRYGIPTELKYLAVIESDLKTHAVSWAGAVGPWQFMPETARLMGLAVNKRVDERKDFTKSTHAAARYLNNLYKLYNDWLLVIAAYNGGPGKVNAAIKKSGSRNFWKLQNHLPAESRKHVKKFIATHYIMEGDGSLATLTRQETDALKIEPKSVADVSTSTAGIEVTPITGKYNSHVMAQTLQMDLNEFNKLNPGFDKQMASSGSYNLRLPSEKVLVFQASKPQILEKSIKLMLASNTR